MNKEPLKVIKTPRTPWIKNLGGVPSHLEYQQGSMFEAVESIAQKYPDYIAYEFYGRQDHL